MHRRTHAFGRFFILLTALWLPLQALAGMVMPLAVTGTATGTDTGAATSVAAPTEQGEHTCHGQSGVSSQVPVAADDQPCNDCGVCHMACAGYMPASARTPGRMAPEPVLAHTVGAPTPSHINEPPDHPPRASY